MYEYLNATKSRFYRHLTRLRLENCVQQRTEVCTLIVEQPMLDQNNTHAGGRIASVVSGRSLKTMWWLGTDFRHPLFIPREHNDVTDYIGVRLVSPQRLYRIYDNLLSSTKYSSKIRAVLSCAPIHVIKDLGPVLLDVARSYSF